MGEDWELWLDPVDAGLEVDSFGVGWTRRGRGNMPLGAGSADGSDRGAREKWF